jgi:hypothetical protein
MEHETFDQRPIALNADEWLVNLASWVIADGSHDHFAVDTSRRFALEFWTNDLHASPLATKTAVSLGDGQYQVNAHVAHADAHVEFLDFGLTVFREVRASVPPPSSWLEGIVGLGVDPFFYVERYAISGMPPAIYDWAITGIWRETAPLISAQMTGHGKVWIHDPDQLGWEWLDRTDAARSNSYLLRCRREPRPPSRDIEGR